MFRIEIAFNATDCFVVVTIGDLGSVSLVGVVTEELITVDVSDLGVCASLRELCRGDDDLRDNGTE